MIERLLRIVAVPALAVAAATGFGMLFLWFSGYPAIGTFRTILTECFQDMYGLGQVLRATNLLILTGLAVAIAFHAGLFNIGVEGQLYIGAIAVGIAGYYLKGVPKETLQKIPWALCILGLIGVAMISGGIWGMIPGVLKAATGAHEVITTIMMNFIAASLINYLVRPEPGSFAIPGMTHTPSIPQYLRMPRLSNFGGVFPDFRGATVNVALFLALAAVISMWRLLFFSKRGFEIRAVGKNPLAARLAGISPGRTMIFAMFLSGAIAGLVGVEFVLGNKGYFEENFSGGLGFVGIAVALLASNHPVGIIFTAFLFGVLNYGEVAAAEKVPKDLIKIMEAAIIFSVILGNSIFARVLLSLKKRKQRKPE